MTSVLEHPAVDVAAHALRDSGMDMVPVSVRAYDDMAAVLLANDQHRLVMFVGRDGQQWVAPGYSGGSWRPTGERPVVTREPNVLTGVSTASTVDRGEGFAWFALVARAAEDAAEVTVRSDLDTAVVPVGADGSVFAVVRTPVSRAEDGRRRAQAPRVCVGLVDGREVVMRRPL